MFKITTQIKPHHNAIYHEAGKYFKSIGAMVDMYYDESRHLVIEFRQINEDAKMAIFEMKLLGTLEENLFGVKI